jgi:eukaryotic-like serine/threonine-protein kinase
MLQPAGDVRVLPCWRRLQGGRARARNPLLSLAVIGKRFGNYRAVSLLGEGGMGAVYLAEHPEIGRRVAVKVLRPEMIKDPQLLLRFLNEARAANAIRHPNIIEILDSGTTPEGTPYLVMELLEGEVLSGRIRRLGKLSLGDALEFSYQAASALAAAHDKAIIHRDLKPDNLFIVPDPSDPARERIKVLDFGIAKLQTFPTGGGMQTRTGTLMGTPVYMSPEQCLGTKTIDNRSDIYAMGIIMFEMLSGHPPFLSDGFGDLVNMHLNVPPPRLRDIDPSIPQGVEDLVAKALEKSPNARQRSAAELQLDIRTAAGKSIVIRGVSSPDLASATMPGVTAGATTAATLVRDFAGATAMAGATGERVATTMPVARPPVGRRVFLGGVAVAAIAVVVWIAASRSTGGGSKAADRPGDSRASIGMGGGPGPTDPKPAAPVRLTIDSRPSGASVTDVESGRPLGVTPLLVERAGSQGPVTVRVEMAGFEPVTRALDLGRDHTETILLRAVPVEVSKADGPPQSGRPKSEKTKRVGRPRHPVIPMIRNDEPAKL